MNCIFSPDLLLCGLDSPLSLITSSKDYLQFLSWAFLFKQLWTHVLQPQRNPWNWPVILPSLLHNFPTMKIRIAFHLLEILLKTRICSSPSAHSQQKTLCTLRGYINHRRSTSTNYHQLLIPLRSAFVLSSSWGWSLTTRAPWTTNQFCLLSDLTLLFHSLIHIFFFIIVI